MHTGHNSQAPANQREPSPSYAPVLHIDVTTPPTMCLCPIIFCVHAYTHAHTRSSTSTLAGPSSSSMRMRSSTALPSNGVILRSIAVERMPAAVAADAAVDGCSNDDVLVAISSSQGIVQVWHFAPLSSFATSATASASQSPPKHHASPPRRGNAASFDDASPSSHDVPLHPLLCGLHSIGNCAARDDLPVAFVRAAAGSGGAEDGMRVVAADASGTLSAFDVRTQCGGKGGIVDEVMMISRM